MTFHDQSPERDTTFPLLKFWNFPDLISIFSKKKKRRNCLSYKLKYRKNFEIKKYAKYERRYEYN